MKRILASNTFRLISTLVVIGAFVAYFIHNKNDFKPLLDINVAFLFGIAFFYSALVSVNGLFTRLTLEPFNKDLPIFEGVYLAIISSIGNFFAPAGAGFGYRAFYLKRKYDLAFSDYASVLSGYFVISFFINSIAGLIAIQFLGGKGEAQRDVIILGLLAVLVFSIIASIIKVPQKLVDSTKNSLLHGILSILHRVTNGWRKILSTKDVLIKLVLLTLLSLFLSMATTTLIISSLHLSTTLSAITLYSVLGSLSIFINITPGNLGIKEAIYLFAASVMGFSIGQIVLIALVERGVIFVTLLLLWLGTKRMKRRLDMPEATS